LDNSGFFLIFAAELILNDKNMVRKISENDTYEFYDSRGTYSDAQEVQKILKEKYDKDGSLLLDSVYGWIVKVKK
jgi:hypothetical protein